MNFIKKWIGSPGSKHEEGRRHLVLSQLSEPVGLVAAHCAGFVVGAVGN